MAGRHEAGREKIATGVRVVASLLLLEAAVTRWVRRRRR